MTSLLSVKNMPFSIKFVNQPAKMIYVNQPFTIQVKVSIQKGLQSTNTNVNGYIILSTVNLDSYSDSQMQNLLGSNSRIPIVGSTGEKLA